jgi:hypothetical protein
MASTSGNGSTETSFKAESVMPHVVDTAGGFKPSEYVSKGGKSRQQQEGGSLAFSELKGGKKKRSRKTSKKSSKKTSKRRGKKTMKTMLKGIFGIFKK